MDILESIKNLLVVVAFLSFIILLISMRKQGNDERTIFITQKVFKSMYTILLLGIALVFLINIWSELSYESFKLGISLIVSFNLLYGVGYWFYLIK